MPEIDRLETWLLANLPEDDGAISIAHGDFRLGNLIFAHDSPKVVGILDWELSTLGHPLADLGFCCMAWRTMPQEYGGIRGLGLPALGIPSREEFLREYYNHALPTAALEPLPRGLRTVPLRGNLRRHRRTLEAGQCRRGKGR